MTFTVAISLLSEGDFLAQLGVSTNESSLQAPQKQSETASYAL